MKLVLVKITKNTTPGQPRMKYPSIYDPYEIDAVKIGPIIYEGRIARGEDYEHCLICLPDEVADKYAQDPDITIVTKDEADAWLAQNPDLQSRPSETVTDPNRILAIMAKKTAGLDLSEEDLAALDPESPVPGIVKTPKTVAEIYPQYDGE